MMAVDALISDELACIGTDEAGGAIDGDRGTDDADADLLGGDNDEEGNILSETDSAEARLRKKSDPSSVGRGGNLIAAAATGRCGSGSERAKAKDEEEDEDDEDDDDEEDEEDDEDDDDEAKEGRPNDMVDAFGGAASRPDMARSCDGTHVGQ
jgi:translation initiation factor 5B